MATNTVTQLKNFFNIDSKPVDTAEMMEFWKSLSEDEKNELREADLTA